jgi:hypothetical protein
MDRAVRFDDVPLERDADGTEASLPVFLVEERGYTFEQPRRCRYPLPPHVRMRTVRDRSGAPIAVYVRAASPQEALRTYIHIVMAEGGL